MKPQKRNVYGVCIHAKMPDGTVGDLPFYYFVGAQDEDEARKTALHLCFIDYPEFTILSPRRVKYIVLHDVVLSREILDSYEPGEVYEDCDGWWYERPLSKLESCAQYSDEVYEIWRESVLEKASRNVMTGQAEALTYAPGDVRQCP